MRNTLAPKYEWTFMVEGKPLVNAKNWELNKWMNVYVWGKRLNIKAKIWKQKELIKKVFIIYYV